MKWTADKLKRAAMKKLRNKEVIIKLARYNQPHKMEYVVWEPKDGPHCIVTIRVDIHQRGLIPTVIHALIHVAVNKQVEKVMGDSAEENWVLSMEKEIWDNLTMSYRQMRYWRRLIDQSIVSK